MKEDEAIEILENIYEKYVRDCNSEGEYMKQNFAITEAIKVLTEIQQYRAIGTVEECREAKEKQRAKKPKFYAHNYYCGNCGNLVGNNEFKWKRFMYCDKCGHAVLWDGDVN